jgi:glycosyltransferase involved in cell wall biosynthesis
MTAEADLRRHLIFDLSRHIHLPTYLQYLLEFSCEKGCVGELFILVWHTFIRSHADVVRLADKSPRRNVHFVTLTRKERERKKELEAADTGVAIALAELLRAGSAARYAALYDWELLGRYAASVGATHSTVIHLDSYLPLLASGGAAPGPLSGIYFGPTFHYGDFGDGAAKSEQDPRALREKFVLARALRDPGLRTLFFLDPFAAERAGALDGGEKVRFLPDPVRLPAPAPAHVTALREALGIELGRRVFLLFGHLSRRKGAAELLAAVRHLPPELCRRLCLLFVGESNPAYEKELTAAVTDAQARAPVQVVTHLRYVPHGEVPSYFHLADVVLAPYPRHAGMSGIVLLAAAAGRPVLTSSYGLLGELTRRRNLGLAVDVTRPAALAEGLQRFLLADPASLCDRGEIDRLTQEHEADRFAAALLRRHET